MNRYFAYVSWPDVHAYEAAGWLHPRTHVSYPRLAEHGTTMEWLGEGEPPMPRGDEVEA